MVLESGPFFSYLIENPSYITQTTSAWSSSIYLEQKSQVHLGNFAAVTTDLLTTNARQVNYNDKLLSNKAKNDLVMFDRLKNDYDSKD